MTKIINVFLLLKSYLIKDKEYHLFLFNFFLFNRKIMIYFFGNRKFMLNFALKGLMRFKDKIKIFSCIKFETNYYKLTQFIKK